MGAPAFAAPSTNPFGLADVGFRAAPAFADLDGDGDLDALVGNSLGNTLFFRNTGSAVAPAFAAPSTNPFGLADVGSQAAPAFADLDGDGDLDAFVGELRAAPSSSRTPGRRSRRPSPRRRPTRTASPTSGRHASPRLRRPRRRRRPRRLLGGYLGRIFFFENLELDAEACTDGIDNDGDGRTDFSADAGCASTSDTSELSTRQCDNGLDDDSDGKIDWRGDGTGDPQCVSLSDNLEAPAPPPRLRHRPRATAPRAAARGDAKAQTPRLTLTARRA